MDAAAPSTLRAARRRVAKSFVAAAASAARPQAQEFESSRSLLLRPDIFRAVQLRPRAVMLLRFLEHVVVRSRFVFVIVRLAIIFAHRVIDKSIPHQNPSQIRVAIEANTVEIKDFTLLKFGAPINRCERRQQRTVFFTVRSSQSTPVAFEQKSSRRAGSSRKNFATATACSLSIKSEDCCDGPGLATMSILAPATAASARALICSSDSITASAGSSSDERHRNSPAVPNHARQTPAPETRSVALNR